MNTHELTRPTVGEEPGGPADQATGMTASSKPGARGGSSHLFGRGLLYVVVWSLQIVAGVVVSPILAHVLGPEQFGRLASVIALHQVLTVVALLGLDQALVLQRAEDGNDRSARGLVAVGIVISLLVTGVVFVTGPLWSETLGFDGFSTLVVVAILWTAPGAAVQVMLSLLLAQDRLKAFTFVSVFSALGGQIVGIGLLLLVHNDATTYAWGGVICQFAAMAIGIALTRPSIRGLFDWDIAWRAMRLGVPLAMSGLAFFVLNAGDRIVIQRDLGPAEVGRYQVAYTVGYVVVLLLTMTSAAWAPHFVSMRDEVQRWALAAQSRDELYRMLIPIILGVTLAAPVALRIFAPASFEPESLVIVVFLVALSAFPVAASGASGRILLTLRRGKALAVIAGVATVVNIGLNIVLVPVLGIAGAALTTVIAFALLAFLQLLALPETPVWRSPPAGLVIAIGIAVSLAAGSVWLPQTPTWNITRFALAVLCLPWFFVQLRRARRGPDIEALLQSLGGRHRRSRRNINQVIRALGGSVQLTKEPS